MQKSLSSEKFPVKTEATRRPEVLVYRKTTVRLMDGARRPIFLADFLRMKFAARTSCRSQLVRAEEFVFSRRLEKIERLAPSRESTLFLSHILAAGHTTVRQQGKK